MLHILNPLDNVGISLEGCAPGESLRLASPNSPAVSAKDRVPPGHKVALVDIGPGCVIVKYGVPIGKATRPIRPGEHVHSHNVAYDRDMHFGHNIACPPSRVNTKQQQDDTFLGFARSDGRVGVRNYIVVVATSNCAASVVKKICQSFPADRLSQKSIERLVPITYGHGCALELNGKGFELLSLTLAGWVNHPNVVGALLVSLGCESVSGEAIISRISPDAPIFRAGCIRSLTIQEAGGYAASIAKGISEVDGLLEMIVKQERTRMPVSALTVALNCGGSDAFSGLTANPIVGLVSDRLTGLGGAAVLAEIPECCGAEQHLIARCQHPADGVRIHEMFEWWAGYVKSQGIELNDNISAGNVEGGITTILEKSLGALSKGGASQISQALGYAERITRPGLALMDTPGYDPVSMTGLVAGGCVIGLFTTGRGSLYGCSIAPVLKIASNTRMFKHMSNDMDINAGVALEGEFAEDVAERLYALTLQVASGKQTASERNGIGDDEFVPWTPKETL